MKYLLLVLCLALAHCQKKAKEPKQYCDDGKANLGPRMLVTPEPVYNVQIGDRVKIECIAHGYPEPYVYWTKGPDANGEVKPKSSKRHQLGPRAVGKSTLYFEQISAEDVDYYQCVVEDCCSGKKTITDIEIMTPVEADCGDLYGDSYMVFGATWKYKNWTMAKQACEEEGLELAMPMNAEENLQLYKDIQTSFNREPNAKKFAHENWVWLGGHDCCTAAEEGNWKTWDDQPLEWFNWAPQQPDNWQGPNNYEPGQDCVGMSRETGQWDDSFQYHVRPYVCRCPRRVNKKKKNKKNKNKRGE